jgi:hypothetical protein
VIKYGWLVVEHWSSHPLWNQSKDPSQERGCPDDGQESIGQLSFRPLIKYLQLLANYREDGSGNSCSRKTACNSPPWPLIKHRRKGE